ncbi:hypothetical protein SUGI_0189720 [Cryptomeria japonica]|uniref:nitrate reductase [NADH] 2 n=1 Tax=Cryptomeria japonica TaxID=3369 RepID=UPI002408DCEB|nr:nitrate reductase [NADH] 2 [Cryptomeria japonica]GLJ12378.1 hypothetical protein SUGI_0189720 [Cryptomeria japonica]
MAASVGNRQFNVEGRNGLISYGSRSHLGRKVPESIPTRDFFELQTPRPKALQEEEEEEEEDDVVWEFPEEEETAADPRDAGTADEWVKRNSHLVRLTGRHPFNCEAPLCRLMRHGFITPVSLHYVRNHGHVPHCSWDDWRVEVCGLVKRPMQLSMEQLVEEFKPRELPVTLVCAGNRRKEQNMVKQTIGFNWGAAGVSTSVWRGARLADLLRRCGIMSKKKGALYVCFEGAEDLPGGGGSKYGTSISVDIAMDYARDVIVAYRQNGELLQPDHGFPVRVIIPGFIGGRMVKWLRCIRVSSVQSDNYYHHRDNKVLPSHVDADSAISQGWWNKPEYIINELNINSVITTPSHEEILPINSSTTQRPYALKGYAYSGGGRKVIRVEVTFDGGETWKLCSLTHPEKPKKYGKHWCWCFWELEVEVMELLSAKEIAVRAWDESMNTQPKDLTWNVMGMMNNCWFRVKLNLCMPHHGEIGLVFEHPTRPGNQSGGWMAREKQLEDTQLQTNHTLKKSSSTPMMNTASKNITLSEVQKHNNAESAWIIVHNHVYDCTKFLKDHPGGMDSILINAGSDCTEEFDAIHSSKAKAMLEDYRIGELLTSSLTGGSSSSCESSPDNSMHGANRVFAALRLAPITELHISKPPPALNPKQNITCKLVSKKEVSHDVRLFRFALPSPDQNLGLPTGKHIFVSAYIDDKLCMRAYTPVSSDDELGHFDLLVKIYFKGVHPKFPDGGLMSQYLETMAVGESIKVKGPVGHIQYHGQGHFTINGHTKLCKTIAMVGGGTGITPLYQVIMAVLKDPTDETQIHLVYANRTEDDILLREQLDQFSEHHSNFKVWYVISNSVKEGWKYSLGIINEEILRDHLPDGLSPDTLALMCGPPHMIQLACLPNLAKMNYDVKNSCFQF